MNKRSAIATFTTLSAALLAASVVAGAPANATDIKTPLDASCTAVYFNVASGQGVETFCDHAPSTYQVVAQCTDNVQLWTAPGTFAVADAAPSVAECQGWLLAPARVISYFVAS